MDEYVDYFRKGDLIEIIIRDSTYAKIESYKCSLNDKKASSIVMKTLKDKWGFAPVIEPDDKDFMTF